MALEDVPPECRRIHSRLLESGEPVFSHRIVNAVHLRQRVVDDCLRTLRDLGLATYTRDGRWRAIRTSTAASPGSSVAITQVSQGSESPRATHSCAHLEGLTGGQRDVVALPSDGRALVLGGAGSGKTHVLLRRATHLVDCLEAAPGDELLILTFTRAVAAELKRRLRSSGGRIAYVTAMTIDAFATRLLSECRDDEDWRRSSYNERIRLAAKLFESRPEPLLHVIEHTHLFVDEVQDLVDVRAAFVAKLLESSTAGFTLFGDWAQAIYDWQESGSRYAGSGDEFRELIERKLKNVSTHYFAENFRVSTDEAGVAIGFGALLNEPAPDYEMIREGLDDILDGLPRLTLNLIGPAQAALEGTAAILTRSNGQSLLVARELSSLGVPHRLRPRASDRAYAGWIAAVFGASGRESVSRRWFEDRVSELGLVDHLQVHDAWLAMRRVAGGRGDGVDPQRFRNALHAGVLPDDLADHGVAALEVSTIHRAKGLEFDRVYILENISDGFGEDEDFEEETRVRYVALTRCRREMPKLARVNDRGTWRDDRADRWYVGPRKWQTNGFEFRPDDVDSEYPAGGRLIDGDVVGLQAYLADRVTPGDEIALRLLHDPGSGSQAYYSVNHVLPDEERAIGVTSTAFAKDLHTSARGRWANSAWPRAMTNLYVQGVDTVAGSVAAGENGGLGRWGLWLRPRVAGMARCIYDRR